MADDFWVIASRRRRSYAGNKRRRGDKVRRIIGEVTIERVWIERLGLGSEMNVIFEDDCYPRVYRRSLLFSIGPPKWESPIQFNTTPSACRQSAFHSSSRGEKIDREKKGTLFHLGDKFLGPMTKNQVKNIGGQQNLAALVSHDVHNTITVNG